MILLVITAVATGLMAGLFFAWSVSVMPGIGRLADREFILSMQAMNRAILNPLFLSIFMGTAVLLPLSTYLSYQGAASPRFWLLLAATVLYLAGIMGVTMAGNVPLNEKLDAFNIEQATADEISRFRAQFEDTWNRLNNMRTVANTLSLAMIIWACLSRGSGK